VTRNFKLTPRDRRAVLIGAALLAVLVVGRVVVLPVAGYWSGARARTAAARSQLSRMQTQLAQIVSQQGRLWGQIGPAVAKGLADAETARMGLFESAQAALRQAGFNATGFAPQKPRRLTSLPGVQEIDLQVRGKCNPGQLANALAQLCKTPTLVAVRQLNVDNDEKKPGELDATLTLFTLAREGGKP